MYAVVTMKVGIRLPKGATLIEACDVVGDKDRIVKVQSDDLEEIGTYHATSAGWEVI